jgi:hypothetical protein
LVINHSAKVRITMKPISKEQRLAALEKAAEERSEREARGESEPLDEWPDGPPEGDAEAIERYLVALRQWHERHVGPVTDAEWLQVRSDHGLA